MNVLSQEDRVKVVKCLVEGNSLRATTRITGVHRTTIQNLLVDLGRACTEFHDKTVHGLRTERVQCDEIWSFIGCKRNNVPQHLRGTVGIGDCWTWTALDADSKLAISWTVGLRQMEYCRAFLEDLHSRLTGRIQLSTDGLHHYVRSVLEVFGSENVDYAMIEKIYRGESGKTAEARYSPNTLQKVKVDDVFGSPDRRHASTSYVERQNLTMRMGMRRFTRLMNGFSKKIENHQAAVALHFTHYNFCRVHMSLRCTPAMEAGIADHVWSI